MEYLHEEQDLGKVYDARLMKRLLAYARPYSRLIAVCVVLLLVVAVIDLARPYLVKTAIDNYILGWNQNGVGAETLTGEELQALRASSTQAIVRLGWVLFAVLTVGFVLNYIQVYLLQYTGQRIVYDIRQHVFSHIESLSLSFFDGQPVGRLVTRVTNDTENLLEMYTSVLVNLSKDVFMLAGIVIVMFRLNARLAWVSLSALPVIILITVVFRIKAREAYREVRAKLAKINAFMAENISGMRLVQIFRQEKRKLKEFDQVNTEHYQASMKELKVYAVFRPAMELLGSLATALLIWVGGGDVIRGVTEFGTLFAMINYLEMFFRPINDLTEKYNIMQSAMASAERVFQILDTEPAIKDLAEPKHLPAVKGRIEFRNVWFAYHGEDWVLEDVSFVIEPGETAAFVGATGAGKTTIMSLITRFYDIQRGQILLDGVDIRLLSQDELRRHISIVMQDVFLFSGTIKDNIRLGNKDITDERVEEVARYVNAHHFIEQLPQKYDEPVMERGATLSAGQRQLLAFARALAFDPAVLILDEATANIDTETEQLIQEALPRLLAGRTSIVVAHRLSTIQRADKIIVMHKGQIREMGTHQELLAKRGLYYNLFLLQYKDEFQDTVAGA